MNQIIISICISTVGLGLIDILLPDSKTAEIFINLLFVCAVLFPFLGGNTESFNLNDISYSETVSPAYTEQNTAAAIENTLKKQGIDYKKVTAFSSISKEGGISITKVEIITNENKEKVLFAVSGAPFQIEVKNENE